MTQPAKLTPRQMKVYKLFLSCYPKAVSRYANGFSSGITYSIVQALVNKGYLINTNQKIHAYERRLYRAVPMDQIETKP